MAPTITYTSIKLNGTEIGLSGTCKASFKSPYNKIIIKLKSDVSLRVFEARVTKFTDAYDIDLGTCPIFSTNIAANTETTFDLNINSTYFTAGQTAYRIGLYAQDAATGIWDTTYLFLSFNNIVFMPNNSDGMEVLLDRNITQS